MAALAPTTRKVLALASLAVAAGLAAPTAASAKDYGMAVCAMTGKCGGGPKVKLNYNPNLKYGYKPYYGGGYGKGWGGPGWGYGAAAMGGLAVGVMAASAASASAAPVEEGTCYVRRRWAVDEEGNQYIRRVRVCD